MLRSIANIMKISGCEVPDWKKKKKKLEYLFEKDEYGN